MHPKILNTHQKAVLREVAQWVRDEGFYLGGGLALGLQLGHRRSLDFDWFREAPIDDPKQLIEDFERIVGADFKIDRLAPNTVLGTIKGVHASFFWYLHPMIGGVVEYEGMPLASLEDLAAMKLLAIAQRGRKRDFIDLHTLLKKKFQLKQMIDFFTQKYPTADVRSLLRSLTYFTDADRDVSPKTILKVSWPQVKRDIEVAVTVYQVDEGLY